MNITRTRQIHILDVDVNGNVKEREVAPGGEMWLDNTLAGHLYPNLKLALVSVPTGILEWDEQAGVTDSLVNIQFKGTTYRMIGSGGGAKNGKFYFADSEHAPMLHKRFQNWPEALIAYFGIQTSDCRRIHDFNGTVLVVPDGELGTNDCGAYIRESWAAILELPQGRFYQFRCGFGFENGKGTFKMMPDNVADAIGADIVLPESSCKPAPLGLKPWNYDKRAERCFTGPVVVGIREISRELVFASSYTVAQHASWEVIQTEIIPSARANMQALKDAWTAGNHAAVVEMIGKKISIDEFAQNDGDNDGEVEASEEMRTVEAAMLADGSGEILQHPYVYRQVDKLLAKWAYKLLTGGGLHLPGFALSHDGYLFLDQNGKVNCGSDWLPKNLALASMNSARSLCVRYPVRMKEDLLPMTHSRREKTIALLVTAMGLEESDAMWVADNQLYLTGTYTLHSKKAKENGGDFDFDQICVVDEDLYPKFVEERFNFKSTHVVTKFKADKLKSPIYSLEHVAMKSLGNQIGVITNTMSSCIAAGKMARMYELVAELQKEIDSLKHNTRADMKVIKEIQAEAPKAPWLSLKDVKAVSELRDLEYVTPKGAEKPVYVPLPDTDIIGRMYQALRSDLVGMMNKPMQVRQFQGLIMGHKPTKEMLQECRTVYYAFTAGHAMLRKVLEAKQTRIDALTAEFESAKEKGLKESVKKLRKELAKLRADFKQAEEIHKKKSATLIGIVAAWADWKKDDRKAWCQALHSVASSGNGSGSIIFHAFPQEVIDAIAERTGGIRTKVASRECHVHVEIVNDTFVSVSTTFGRVEKFRYDAEKRMLVPPTRNAA